MKPSSPIYQLKRRARSMAREQGIPLHRAQDSIAGLEGFASWSLLASKVASGLSDGLLDRLEDGDLVLLAARPGQGKTIIGLKTLLDARRAGRRAILFTLDLTEQQARHHLEQMGSLNLAASVEVQTSDDIDANFIADVLLDPTPGTVVVVDYLQLLDERRSKPSLADQVGRLHQLAKSKKAVLVVLSQIDRAFDSAQRKTPGMADVRLPNPLPMELFNKRLFLHNGEVRMESFA